MIGILPTLMPDHVTLDSVSENPRYSLLDQQIFAARGEDLEIVIDGVERLQMISDTIMPEAACTSTQVHLQVSPDDFAGYWNAAQAIAGIQVAVGRQLAVPVRPAAGRRVADPAVRAEHRHPQRGAQGPGRTPPGVVRRAVDHLDLRPLRGELALLPRAAADLLRRGPGGRAGRRGGAAAGRAAPAQRHGLPLEPPGLRRPRRHGRTYGSRTGSCPPARRWWTPWRTRRSSPAWCGPWPTTSGRSGPRCRSRRRTRTSSPGSSPASTPRFTGRESGQVRVVELVVRKLLPLAAEGLRLWEVDEAEIGRLLDIVERRCLRIANGATWQTAQVARLEAGGGVPAGGAARHAAPLHRPDAQQRAGPHLGGALMSETVAQP